MSSAVLPTIWDLKPEQEISLCCVPGVWGLACYCSMTSPMLTSTLVRRPVPKSRRDDGGLDWSTVGREGPERMVWERFRR